MEGTCWPLPASLPELQELELTSVGKCTLAARQMPQLRRLVLRDCRGDHGWGCVPELEDVLWVAGLPRLEVLCLVGNWLSDGDKAAVKAALRSSVRCCTGSAMTRGDGTSWRC